jgi:hypothetical protein
LQLLTFAHRGEAQTFLKSDNYQVVENVPFDGLFSSKDTYLLITGEGIEKSMFKLSLCLGRIPEVTEILNFGVCASLNDSQSREEIYSIRTVYASTDEEMKFHSFTSSDAEAFLDTVTTGQRVLDPSQVDRLESFAPLADRELWSIAYCAFNANIPWRSFKLVSDFPSRDEGKEICQAVKEKAPFWSDLLYGRFQKMSGDIQTEKKQNDLPASHNLDLSDFYFSVTSKRQLNKYLSIIESSNDLKSKLAKLDIESIKKQSKSPKERSKILLTKLRFLANPFMSELNEQLQTLNKPLTSIGAKVSFDQNLDSDSAKIHFAVTSRNSLEMFKRALSMWPYHSIQNLLNGKIDDL